MCYSAADGMEFRLAGTNNLLHFLFFSFFSLTCVCLCRLRCATLKSYIQYYENQKIKIQLVVIASFASLLPLPKSPTWLESLRHASAGIEGGGEVREKRRKERGKRGEGWEGLRKGWGGRAFTSTRPGLLCVWWKRGDVIGRCLISWRKRDEHSWAYSFLFSHRQVDRDIVF